MFIGGSERRAIARCLPPLVNGNNAFRAARAAFSQPPIFPVSDSNDPAKEQAVLPEGAPLTEAPFSSSHTSNFPALLHKLGISIVVSTYQAGRLIFVRAQGDELNTHFRQFFSPMGVAYQHDTGRLAIGV